MHLPKSRSSHYSTARPGVTRLQQRSRLRISDGGHALEGRVRSKCRVQLTRTVGGRMVEQLLEIVEANIARIACCRRSLRFVNGLCTIVQHSE